MTANKEISTQKNTNIERNYQIPDVAPAVDIFENEDEILLHAEMPGVKKEDIVVNIDNGKLELSGIRKLETAGAANWQEFEDVEYRRSFSVPQSIDLAKINAELKEGILRLHLPKSDKAKPRQIEIKAA